MKKFATFLAATLMVVSLSSCGGRPNNLEFNLTQEEVTLKALGETETLKAMYGEEVVFDATYEVLDETVCKVLNGVVYAVGEGNTTITAKLDVNGNIKEDICTVNVESEFSISFDKEESVFQKATGDSFDVKASVRYPNVFYKDLGVKYESNNAKVATVDENGHIECVGKGIAMVTATSVVEITDHIVMPNFEMTTTAPAKKQITVIVDNEFNKETHKDLLGTFKNTFDWQGFAVKDEAQWNAENLMWIRAISTLTFNEDGTFVQQVLNAQRLGYKLDTENFANCKNCYVYNKADQKAETIDGKEFGEIKGMLASGMHNFAEKGTFAIADGQLVLAYKGKVQILGNVANNEWSLKAYKPFTNMVPMNANMTMVLSKVAA